MGFDVFRDKAGINSIEYAFAETEWADQDIVPWAIPEITDMLQQIADDRGDQTRVVVI